MRRKHKEKISYGKIALILFAIALFMFLTISIVRSGMLNRQAEDIIARVDMKLDKYERD